MAQPLAWVFVRVRVIWRLVNNADLHFVNAHARGGVVGDVEIARERAQLLELRLIDDDIFPISQR